MPGTTGSLTLGGAASDGTGEGTPAFNVGPHGQAGALTLAVDFSKVTRNPWQYWSSATPLLNSAFFSDTSVTSGPAGADPLVAHCNDDSVCSELFNATTGHWEGAQ